MSNDDDYNIVITKLKFIIYVIIIIIIIIKSSKSCSLEVRK
jgi:hypothetical protein